MGVPTQGRKNPAGPRRNRKNQDKTTAKHQEEPKRTRENQKEPRRTKKNKEEPRERRRTRKNEEETGRTRGKQDEPGNPSKTIMTLMYQQKQLVLSVFILARFRVIRRGYKMRGNTYHQSMFLLVCFFVAKMVPKVSNMVLK